MKKAALPLGLCLAFGAAPVRAQESASATPAIASTPVFQSDVSLVLLPVFVTDRDGKAVRGLGASDFEVQQDGRPAEVVSFRYVDTTDDDDNEEAARITSAARRRFLLLFDKSFTEPVGLDRARRAAGDFVRRRLAPTDLAAVATFDVQNGVRLVTAFTSDRALLTHATATLGVPSLSRIKDPLGLSADFQVTDLQIAAAADDAASQSGNPAINAAAQTVALQMRAADEQYYLSNVNTLLEGLSGMAAALRGVPGRKQVLYFSAGFDSRVLVGHWGSEQAATGDAVERGRLWEVDNKSRFGDSRLRDTLNRTTRDIAAADTVVHTIDVTGLGSDGSMTQTTATKDPGRDTTNRESLGVLSKDTGGRLFGNSNELGPALAEMLEMTSRYYVLGIQPERPKGDAAYHRLKVKVARKGVKLSHRPGYFERSASGAAQTPLQRQFDLAELVMSGEGRDELPFTTLCVPYPSRGVKQRLALAVQVPRESLAWSGKEPMGIEVYGYAVAEDGTVHDHLAQSLRVDPARVDAQDRMAGLSFAGSFEVPPGRYTIKLMVRDSTSGKKAVRFLDMVVPPYDARAVFALPPLVLDESERWLSLDLGAGKTAPGTVEPPFLLDARPFVPRTSFEVRPGLKEKLVLMVWAPGPRGDPAADLEIRSSLTASGGRQVQPGRLKVEKVHYEAGGRRTFVFSYMPDAIEPGDYTLKIRLGENGGFAQSYALLRFRDVAKAARGME